MDAKSSFTITTWDAMPYDEAEGATLSKTSIEKIFTGDLEGTSRAEALMAVSPVEGSAAYVAIERIAGTLHGRTGTFVLHHSATSTAGGAQEGTWTIVPDTGTGELAGITGTAEITRDEAGGHAITLDYDVR
jgi:hypothetical protein